jgi:uncharacterized membrane protein
MCYLFIDAGLVQLIIEILRFHHEDPVLVYRCLDIMCVLLEVPSLMQPVIEVFMRDMDNLVLIVVLMDRYYHDASVDNADNHVLHQSVVDDHDDSDGETSHMESMACIVYMLSLFVKTGVIRDQLINTYRIYRFYEVLHFMLDRCSDHHHQQQEHHYQDNNYQQQQQQHSRHHRYSSELYCRLCLIISNIYYDDSHFRNSLLYTSDYKENVREDKKIMQDQLNSKVLINYINVLLQDHFDNQIICSHGYVAISNLVFNNDAIKVEVYAQHVYKVMISMMKDTMKKINSLSHFNNINSSSSSSSSSSRSSSSSSSSSSSIYHNNNTNIDDSIPAGVSNNKIIEHNNIIIDIVSMKDCLYEGLIAACNLIIIPSYLSLDTVSTTLNEEIFHPINTTKDENLLLASSVRPDKNNIAYEFIHGGMCELVMNIMTNYLHDRQLIYGALAFIHKLIYRGRYISCYRLVNIRICEQVNKLI